MEELRRFTAPRARANGHSVDVLKRFMSPEKPRRAPGEQCEMCGEAISEDHSHVVNLESRSLLCACRGCYLLFTSEGAAGGKYRAVPDRYLHDPNFKISAGQWEAIQIPVRTAFFFYNSSLENIVALYPSPGGATESLLPLDTWEEVMKANPAFTSLAPDVEALLVNKSDDGFECFLVPIDAAYELVGLVRLHWKGFDGGEEAWRNIGGFFSRLRRDSRGVAPGVRDE